MPGMDGKGPESKGSQTGRGLGNCTTSTHEKQINNQKPQGRGPGFGNGLNSGRGRGFGRKGINNQPSKENK